MEREILFRGKRLDNRAWAYGYLVKRPSAIQMPGYGGPWYIWKPPADPDDFGGYYNVAPDTVGQYTGMTDKRGTKIFEGDLLKYTLKYTGCEDDSPYRVFWDDFAWYVQCETRKSERLGISLPEDWEIIGNIYENPEILEVNG